MQADVVHDRQPRGGPSLGPSVPEAAAGADPGAVIRVCANCGATMEERKCKLICRSCGYFLSCADYV